MKKTKIIKDCPTCAYRDKKNSGCKRPGIKKFLRGIGESCGPNRTYWKSEKKRKVVHQCINCDYDSPTGCNRPPTADGRDTVCGKNGRYWKLRRSKPEVKDLRTFTVSISDSYVEYTYPLIVSGNNSIERIYKQLCLQMGATPIKGKIRRRLYA